MRIEKNNYREKKLLITNEIFGVTELNRPTVGLKLWYSLRKNTSWDHAVVHDGHGFSTIP